MRSKRCAVQNQGITLNLSFISMFSKLEMEARFNHIFALKCMHHLQTVKIELDPVYMEWGTPV